MNIRLLCRNDLNELMRLKEAAGWNQTEEDWLRLLRLQPEGCIGVEEDGRIVASTTVICYGSDLAWIGMVLTLPDYRGRGHARRLMERALQFAGQRTVRLDASDMGLPLYASLGFREECLVERWSREAAPHRASERRLAFRPDYDMDREVFGAARTRLLQELALYEGGSIRDRAYALGRPGSNATYLGPCVSETPGLARELFSWFISHHSSERIYLDLFPSNGNAVRLAQEFGFKAERRLTRMVLPASRETPPDPRIYAIAGFEYG
ncbi:MAG: GNAT family N-acetyltransferase [Bryobacteraceae bacterium]